MTITGQEPICYNTSTISYDDANMVKIKTAYS